MTHHIILSVRKKLFHTCQEMSVIILYRSDDEQMDKNIYIFLIHHYPLTLKEE